MNTPGKKIGEMTPAERAEVVRRAVRRFQKELDETAEKIGEALNIESEES